jgi:hypothetical protein
MSNWNNSDIISMLSTKMTREADLLRNILESDTQDYAKIKALLQENFHCDEDADFQTDKFGKIQRKSNENILNYAFRSIRIINWSLKRNWLLSLNFCNKNFYKA